jgi:hypothetical protein
LKIVLGLMGTYNRKFYNYVNKYFRNYAQFGGISQQAKVK